MDRDEELLTSLGGWSGFEIAGFERHQGDPEEVWITPRRKDKTPLFCGVCGHEARRVWNAPVLWPPGLLGFPHFS